MYSRIDRLSHWLGRPSHIDDRQFSTAQLSVDDFTFLSDSPLDASSWESTSAFVMLSRLTAVLSSLLDHFYTVNRSSSVMAPEEALFKASHCQAQLKDVLEQQGGILLHPSRGINSAYS